MRLKRILREKMIVRFNGYKAWDDKPGKIKNMWFSGRTLMTSSVEHPVFKREAFLLGKKQSFNLST